MTTCPSNQSLIMRKKCVETRKVNVFLIATVIIFVLGLVSRWSNLFGVGDILFTILFGLALLMMIPIYMIDAPFLMIGLILHYIASILVIWFEFTYRDDIAIILESIGLVFIFLNLGYKVMKQRK